LARRRSRRRKSSYRQADGKSVISTEDLSPRARRLVESGVIDVSTIEGTGTGGRITSGDVLYAARLIEVEKSVARIEATNNGASGRGVGTEPQPAAPASVEPVEQFNGDADGAGSDVAGVEPIAAERAAWDDYDGRTEGLSESARPGADQSWGEAEAHLAAMADAAANETFAPAAAHQVDSEAPHEAEPAPATQESLEPEPYVTPPASSHEVAPPPIGERIEPEPAPDWQVASPTQETEVISTEPEPGEAPAAEIHREVMMDFGTLEMVDPESVWAEGAEDFAPWFLAHSRQLGDVLGLRAGLSDARQFTTKSATGVLGRDDSGEDVVVVSSKNAVAADSDLGNALGMAAQSGAASVALVSAAFHDDQLKALAWLNSQTKSGVKWYGIEMQVVRIADSPAAMLFNLVAAPPS
jgi:hypothetical protein